MFRLVSLSYISNAYIRVVYSLSYILFGSKLCINNSVITHQKVILSSPLSTYIYTSVLFFYSAIFACV